MIIECENFKEQYFSPLNVEESLSFEMMNEGLQSVILHQLSCITSVPELKQRSDLMEPISRLGT